MQTTPINHPEVAVAASDTVIRNSRYINKTTAESILGQAAALTDQFEKQTDSSSRFSCTYTALAPDSHTGQTGHLYYMLEEYNNAAVAHQSYTNLFQNNAKLPGIEKINGMGNEAYFQTDTRNYYFIIFRKGKTMVRMKVNRVTALTSADQLKKAAAALASVI